MGDLDDDFRAMRDYRRQVRATWVECPECRIAYGGNGTKNPPGVRCRNCGWVDPVLAETCQDCHRNFATPGALADHRKAKHLAEDK